MEAEYIDQSYQKTFIKNLMEWAVAIVAALVLFFFVRNYVFRVADVNGHSMEPTLSHGDMVVLSRVGYWFGEPEAGDIIAFPFRENPSEYYIKRIIGTPGDVVDFQNSRFIVNGQELDYDFAQVDTMSQGDTTLPVTVEDGYFFVLGDNRNFSKDSRYQAVGAISERDMLGRVVIRFWPLDRFGTVSGS
ncbi:MAG: signal peptidase I [Defluviitaleaceae bacterium]|nr:signal peptidase I [Defluviitaleaceae bacterium]